MSYDFVDTSKEDISYIWGRDIFFLFDCLSEKFVCSTSTFKWEFIKTLQALLLRRYEDLPVIWHFDWTIFDGFVSLLTWILASVFSESWLNNGVFVTLN